MPHDPGGAGAYLRQRIACATTAFAASRSLMTLVGWITFGILVATATFIAYIVHRDQPHLAHLKLDVSPDAIAVMVGTGQDAPDAPLTPVPLPPGPRPIDWAISIENPIAGQHRTVYIYGLSADGRVVNMRDLLLGSRIFPLLRNADWAPYGYVLEVPHGEKIDLPTIRGAASISVHYLKDKPGFFVLTLNGHQVLLPTAANRADIGAFTAVAPRAHALNGYNTTVEFDFNSRSRLDVRSIPEKSATVTALLSNERAGLLARVSGDTVVFSSANKLSGIIWLVSFLYCGLIVLFFRALNCDDLAISLPRKRIAEGLLVSACFIFFYTLLFYPGFAQNDTVAVVEDALRWASDGVLHGTLQTRMNTLIAYVSIAGSGSQFLAAAFIAVLIITCIYAIIALLCNRAMALTGLLLINTWPVFWNNIFSFTSDSLATAGYLLFASALLLSRADKDGADFNLIATLTVAGSALFAGSRHNSMVAAVVFLCLMTAFRRHMAFRRGIVRSAWVGVLVAVILNGSPGPQHRQLSDMVMAWELVGVSRFVNDEHVEGFLRQIGDAEAARRLFDPSLFDNVVIGRPPQSSPPLDISKAPSTGETSRLYFSTMLRHPFAFLRSKVEIWGAVWGLNTIHIKTIGTWVLPNARVEGGSIDLNLRPWLGYASTIAISVLMKVAQTWYLSFLFSPAFFLACALAVLGLTWRRDEAMLFLGALLYQTTFMVIAPGFHYRYGWLFTIVSTLLMLIVGWKLLRPLYKRVCAGSWDDPLRLPVEGARSWRAHP
jgi:hypothetical protein